MKLPLSESLIDERFLAHRLRSSSIAGMVGGTVAMGLFVYRYSVEHAWRWDLLAVGVTMAVVKVALMIWFRLTD
jgi:hypothetical protein